MTNHRTVCGECGMGDWQDLEPGDTIKCPWCEEHTELTWLEDYKDE